MHTKFTVATQSAIKGSYSNKVLRWGVCMYTRAKVKFCCAWSSWMVAQGHLGPCACSTRLDCSTLGNPCDASSGYGRMLPPVGRAAMHSLSRSRQTLLYDEVLFPGCLTRPVQNTILGKTASAGWSGM